MNTELLRKRLQGQGPLWLHSSDGREYPVPHPEFVLVGRHNVVIEDEAGMLEVIDPMHVVSIRSGTSRKPRKGGRSR